MNTAWLAVLAISFANNLDNAGVGVAYGLARIRISMFANLWISAITVGITGSAVLFGGAVSHLLPGHAPNAVSATILCAIGLWVMLPALRRSQKPKHPDATPHPGEKRPARWQFSLMHILEDPRRADRDGSRHIDFIEASLLGFALSINNIGGGISAGLLHLSALYTALLSALISFVVISLGGLLSRRAVAAKVNQLAPIVSGIVLIAIGLFELR